MRQEHTHTTWPKEPCDADLITAVIPLTLVGGIQPGQLTSALMCISNLASHFASHFVSHDASQIAWIH